MALCIILDIFTEFLFCVIAVIIHELGHLSAMIYYGYMPDKITISPFEIKIVNYSRQIKSTRENFFIVFFGPFVNFICFILFYLLYLINSNFFVPFAAANLCTCLFNMLPAMSLDGGQLLYILLCKRFSEKTAERVVFFTAVLVLVPLTAVGFIVLLNSKYNFSLLFVCVYIALSLVCRNNRYY